MRLRILIKIKFNVKVVFKVYKQSLTDVLKNGSLECSLKFSRTLFLQTTDRTASENLTDVFIQQIFFLQLKLCLRLIYFHSYSFATSVAKMFSDIFFSIVS